MSGIRLPLDTMAHILGISHDTLQIAYKKNDAVRSCIDEGRASAKTKVHQTLYSMAVGDDKRGRAPNLNAMKFWCSTQEGFKTTQVHEISGIDTKISDEELDKRIAAALETLK